MNAYEVGIYDKFTMSTKSNKEYGESPEVVRRRVESRLPSSSEVLYVVAILPESMED